LKKKDAKSTVIKSIGVGGTSIFSADINKYMNRDPNKPLPLEDRFEPPHKLLDLPESEIKEDQWFKMYGDLVTKYEEQFAENEKMKIEIARRVERYNHNERDYRNEIKQLQRELRVRHGYEKDALQTNEATKLKLLAEINQHIEGYTEKVQELEREELKEIGRKYRSEVAKTKKSIEEKRMKTGDETDNLKEQEAAIKHHLDLITNIAQRIDGENQNLRSKNAELKAKYKEQQHEREELVKQLVKQKK